MADRSSAFLFDWVDWRTSTAVQRMNAQERGLYLEMMIEQWDKGHVPDCPHACAEQIGVEPAEVWVACWPVLRRKFVDRRSQLRDGAVAPVANSYDSTRRLINVRVERTRREQRAAFRRHQAAGQKGGLAKAKKRRDLESSDAIAQPSEALATSTVRIGMDRTGVGSVEKEKVQTTPSKVTHDGPRLRVWSWQHEDLGKRLGGKIDAFDLTGWYSRLEAELARTGESFADPWKWLQERLYLDAKLPLPNLMGKAKEPERRRVPTPEETKAMLARSRADG